MLALRKTKAGFGIEAVEVPEPARPAPGEVTVRVEAVGICGSDVHAYEWTEGYGHMVPYLPLTMGHEFAGRVVAAGAGAAVAEGTRVAVHPRLQRGDGQAAWPGDPRLRGVRLSLGLTADGGFASLVNCRRAMRCRCPMPSMRNSAPWSSRCPWPRRPCSWAGSGSATPCSSSVRGRSGRGSR